MIVVLYVVWVLVCFSLFLYFLYSYFWLWKDDVGSSVCNGDVEKTFIMSKVFVKREKGFWEGFFAPKITLDIVEIDWKGVYVYLIFFFLL